MKETEQRQKDKVTIVKQSQQETEVKFLGRIMPKKGHSLFEYNQFTNEICMATFEKQNVQYGAAVNGDIAVNKTVITRHGCVYCSALNFKNATKKFSKMLMRSIKPIQKNEKNN